jgi:hypothetical protein
MGVQPDLLSDGWIELKDGDESCRTIFNRHYSRHRYADGRKPKLFLGPGEKMVLFRGDGTGVFAWRKFIDDSGQTGVCNAIFRKEGPGRASDMIREAEVFAKRRWAGERFYTLVDPAHVQPTMVRGFPVFGFCYHKAGWKFAGVTKNGKLIWAKESQPDERDGAVASPCERVATPNLPSDTVGEER